MKLTGRKIRLSIEIIVCFFLLQMIIAFIDPILSKLLHLDTSGYLSGMIEYAAAAIIIILYTAKINRRPLSSIGLLRPSLSDIPKGLLLGLCMFIVQQIPLALTGFNYSAMAAAPDWGYIVTMAFFIFLFVGVSEELIFRGFILHRTQELFRSRTAAVVINCLLFYAFHWNRLTFSFGEFYNVTVNALLLCLYFYGSKKRSIVPLMIAHSFYDFLTILLPALLYFVSKV